MKKYLPHLLWTALGTVILSCGKKEEAMEPYVPPVLVDSNWKFETTPVWAEEFDYSGPPKASDWKYDLGGGGWGNNELQNYTNSTSNAMVEGGHLTITARKEDLGGNKYTSARLLSQNIGDFLYGRLEVRAKLPAGRGTWPAIWMLPTDWKYGNWPNSGEIDIVEHVGHDPGNVHFSIHTQEYNWTKNTQKQGTKFIADATTAFHTYRMDWTPYSVTGYYDDVMVYTFVNEGKGSPRWPFDQRFHLMLNLAVGGNWGGVQGVDDSIFPAQFVIDYVRLYKIIR